MNNKGFTLVELLIVVAIIGILVAIAVPNLLDAIDKSKQRATIAEIRLWGIALQDYNATVSKFPPPSGQPPVAAQTAVLMEALPISHAGSARSFFDQHSGNHR